MYSTPQCITRHFLRPITSQQELESLHLGHCWMAPGTTTEPLPPQSQTESVNGDTWLVRQSTPPQLIIQAPSPSRVASSCPLLTNRKQVTGQADQFGVLLCL